MLNNSDSNNQSQASTNVDPEKIRALLETHPSFQVMSIDGLKWIDPHTLTCVDCPFGYIDTALDWLIKNRPWHIHQLYPINEIHAFKWLQHIQENVDFDERWRIFSNDNIWLNPFTAQWQENVKISNRTIDRHCIQLMAHCLCSIPNHLLKNMEALDILRQLLHLRNGEPEKVSSEAYIHGSELFNPKASHPVVKHVHTVQPLKALSEILETEPNRQESNPTIVMEKQAAMNRHHKVDQEHYDFDDAPYKGTATPGFIEVDTGSSGFFPETADIHTDRRETQDIDFSQMSLLEPPHDDRPLQSKSGAFRKTPATSPLIGDQIAGYKIVSLLGKGGMGDVHKAIQMSMQREVAIKIMPPEMCADERFANRFLREARAAGKVNHPNVITCYDVGNDRGYLFMVLELVTGGDVSELMFRLGGRIPVKRALEIMTDCGRGLRAIHKAGIIHRDIKPANIFLSDDGIAKLADLGLARSSSNNTNITQSGVCVGTPAYMSPEQVMGKDSLDIRSDIYSLGVTLFTILSGQNPFMAEDVWTLFEKIVEEPALDIQTLLPELDKDIVTFIKTCMQKKPQHRYQSPGELLKNLDKLR